MAKKKIVYGTRSTATGTDADLYTLSMEAAKELLLILLATFGENDVDHSCRDILSASIFYLQQLVGRNHRLLPSVVSTLPLLLLFGSSSIDMEFSFGLGISLPLLLSKIHCSVEANSAWKW
ncbi:unnamed protein product [Fraxinus pennsylvanica]|uniref:Uncharacterized protein n=1 Tax=Fraxinus pennsylvanica TaxID=56036 RepID=A0AAD2EE18_9LAMI|nr:unnamed protein product [Fraxinus pennsylvanica]